MKLIEKPWQYGTYLAYDEVEEIFVPTEKGVRVLPAPFFYDKKLYFELKHRYEPGEKKTFPNGGYEVVDVSGGIRSYDLDQLIIHPAVLQHKKKLDKMARRAEKQAKKRERTLKKMRKEPKNTTGKRGRPANPNKVVVVREKTGGRRGRPALSAEAKAAREAAKVAQTKRSGGKRGRPKRAK